MRRKHELWGLGGKGSRKGWKEQGETMKGKGKNEEYRGEALDRWKISRCMQTACIGCLYPAGEHHTKRTCGGRYEILCFSDCSNGVMQVQVKL